MNKVQVTMIIDLFTLRRRGGVYKFSIHDDNRFIHLPPQRQGVNKVQFIMIIELFIMYNSFMYSLPRKRGVNKV